MRGARYLIAVGVLLIGVRPSTAQSPEPGGTMAEAELLRQRIEERFAERLRTELDLTDEQSRQLRETSREFALKRRELFRDERESRLALEGQMRPGIAADQDSVARLTDRIARSRGALSQSYQDELEALTFLTPVQRARYFSLRERLLDRVRDAQVQRQERQERRRVIPRERERVRAGGVRPRARP